MSAARQVSFYTQPDLKQFLPDSVQPVFQGGKSEMVAGGFRVNVVYGPAPSDADIWYDGTTFFQTPGVTHARLTQSRDFVSMSLPPRFYSISGQTDANFGHVVLNELLSACAIP